LSGKIITNKKPDSPVLRAIRLYAIVKSQPLENHGDNEAQS
jgi:hypothetical protein